MPRLTPSKLIAARHAVRMVNMLHELNKDGSSFFKDGSSFFIKYEVEARKIMVNCIDKAIKADRAEQRRFRRQQDALAAQAKEVADRWIKR